MILKISGDISRTYCQNLCLIYFPGAKFPEDEVQTPTSTVVEVVLREIDGAFISKVVIWVGDKAYYGRADVKTGENTADRAKKLSVGKAFHQAGAALQGGASPWGILTGVRPAKIAEELKERGLREDEVIRALMDDFCVREDKASLLTEVNMRQERARGLLGEDTVSLYISIPFCPTRCAYCSFVSFSTPKYLSTLPEYMERLKEDIVSAVREINEAGQRITSIYIGGGTPTVLDEGRLEDLLRTVTDSVKGHNILEFTVEAGRPDTVTEEKFKIMTAYGVDRTSINPQILDDDVLKVIGRGHTVEDFYRAFEIARKSGIRSINTDLIAGLPTATEESFCRTVDRIAELSPENVTVHTYCVKRSATFTAEAHEQGDKRGIYSFGGGVTGLCVDYAQKKLKENAYFPYYLYRQKNAQGNLENVGFCKEGYEGLYNIFIMEELQSIRALGAGAVSKTVGAKGEKIKRIFEPKYTYEYINKERK